MITEQEQAMQRLHEDISSKDEESRKHQSMLEDKMRELEEIRSRKSKTPSTSPVAIAAFSMN